MMNEITNGLKLRSGAGNNTMRCDAMGVEKMDSILHKIDIGMFPTKNAQKRNGTYTMKIAVGMG